MSLVRKALKQAHLDHEAFAKWVDTAPKGKHKRLWDAYEADLKKWNDAQDEMGVWIQKHVDDPIADFNRGYERWQGRLNRYKQRVQVRLGRIFEAFKSDSTS